MRRGEIEKQPSVQVPLRSTEIIRNIQTVNREKRFQSGRFIKIKSCDDIHNNPTSNQGEDTQNRPHYKWETSAPFYVNPIETLRQERLKRERMQQQRIEKEKDKLKVLDLEEIR